MRVKCYYCEHQGEKSEMVRYDDKNFHPYCGQEYLDRKSLYDTISRIFKLKAPGPKNIRLVKLYRDQGYTYIGMINALTYHYDIKHGDINKAEARIGIVPYVYEEGNEYYNKLNTRKEIISNSANQLANKIETTNKVTIEQIHNQPLLQPLKFTNPFEEE